MKHNIPILMATQHPDNASAPPWERDGDGFVSVHEEPDECYWSYRTLGVDEFMWDWEGKHADEAVIDKLFTQYHTFFKKHPLGKRIFLTFRIPNIWQERGYHLIRALMVILTSEDFAKDIRFHTPPLFEVILPMTERADQLIYIQRAFRTLARCKTDTFTVHEHRNRDYLSIIPLIESVEHQMAIGALLTRYHALHRKTFKTDPPYLRPFLARSDPALVSGLPATVLANKIALSQIAAFSRTTRIPTYPIIGVGSLPFRGGLHPLHIDDFINEYRGIRTVTIQSSYRYDYPRATVRRSLERLRRLLPRTRPDLLTPTDEARLRHFVQYFSESYQLHLSRIVSFMRPLFAAVPQRRARRQHIGLLAYARRMGAHTLPRAINFTAAFYSIGVPPEFLGVGHALARLSPHDRALVDRFYRNMKQDLIRAGRYINKNNLNLLAQQHHAWRAIRDDIHLLEGVLGVTFGPRTTAERMHANLAANVLLLRTGNRRALTQLITETAILRKSLG